MSGVLRAAAAALALGLAGCSHSVTLMAADGTMGTGIAKGSGGGGTLEVQIAHSNDCSHRFRLKPATCSDRSQPGIPMIPAG